MCIRSLLLKKSFLNSFWLSDCHVLVDFNEKLCELASYSYYFPFITACFLSISWICASIPWASAETALKDYVTTLLKSKGLLHLTVGALLLGTYLPRFLWPNVWIPALSLTVCMSLYKSQKLLESFSSLWNGDYTPDFYLLGPNWGPNDTVCI